MGGRVEYWLDLNRKLRCGAFVDEINVMTGGDWILGCDIDLS